MDGKHFTVGVVSLFYNSTNYGGVLQSYALKQKNIFQKSLSTYDSISVREREAVNVLQPLTDKKIEWVLDSNQINASLATKKYKDEYFDCIIKCYKRSKIFVYGELNVYGDAIDELFCINCINLTQLVYKSKLNGKQKRERINQLINNKLFLLITSKYKPKAIPSIQVFFVLHKRVYFLFMYYRIKIFLKCVKKHIHVG